MRVPWNPIIPIIVVSVGFTLSELSPSSAQTEPQIDSRTAAQVLPDAEMSQDVYSDTENPASTPGWTPVTTTWQQFFASHGLGSEVDGAIASGFYARVYKDAFGDITVAFRSTTGWQEFSHTDKPAQEGMIPPQYEYAAQLAGIIKQTYPNAFITLTGHSLGGGLATYGAQLVPGISNVVTFNSARPPILSSATLGSVKQINVVVPGDAIGNPKAGGDPILGLGSLPGKTYQITSTTAVTTDLPTKLSTLEGRWDSSATHSLQGIVGGLQKAISSQSVSSTPPVGTPVPKDSPQSTSLESKKIQTVEIAPTKPAAPPSSPSNAVQSPGRVATIGPIAKPVIVGTPTAVGVPAAHDSTFGAAPSAHIASSPGGISISIAAAERLPLNLTLDGAYIANGRIILSGRKNSNGSIDAALFLTALRAACAGTDPYFSLDPDNMASWLAETRQAQTELHEAIKQVGTWHFRKHIQRNAPSILRFQTVSASRDYPQLWNSMLSKYPDLRSRLIFQPEWLRQTRFGEIMYKADVLLKELAGGATALGEARFRAAGIGGYLSATERMAALRLLYQYSGRSEQQGPSAGGRIWYDLTESSNTAVGQPQEIPQAKSELRNLLERRKLLTSATEQSPAQKISENGGAIDLSDIFPRMFVRIRDPITYRDSAARFPGLDELVAQANQVPQQYAAAYREYDQLVEVFRAYIVAVRAKQAQPELCTHLPTELLDSEKVGSPLPGYHPTDFTLTIGWYEYQDGRLRRVIGDMGGLFQGGVSIGANRFFRFAVENVAATPIIMVMKAQAIQPTTSFSWNDNDGRQYVALTFNDIPGTERPVANQSLDTRFPGNVLPSVDQIAEASSPNGSERIGDSNPRNGEQRANPVLHSTQATSPKYAQTNTPPSDSMSTWFALAAAPQGTYGWSKERPSKDAAEEEAFRACASVTTDPEQCKVIIVPKGSCVAIERCTSSGQPAIWSAVSDHLKDALDHSLMQAVAAGMSEKACKPLTHWCPQ